MNLARDEQILAEELNKSEAWAALVRDARAAAQTAGKRRNADREVTCLGCGVVFITREADQQFHSLKCARQNNASKR